MREKWIEYAKKADFNAWAKALNISPLTARLLRNRDILSLEEADAYLNGNMADLADPFLMKDMKKAVNLVTGAIQAGQKIGIITDYDNDGIFSGEILFEGIRRAGGDPHLYTPDRVKDGYGLNRRLVDEAVSDNCRLLMTCDNGIAAVDEVKYAKEKGLTVVVTDHHDVQYTEEDGIRNYRIPPADAVIDPKQADDHYPFKGLCGAGVAFRFMEMLYRRFGIPKAEMEEFYEYVGIATVADVVPLKGENRILVKAGLEKLHRTEKMSLLAICRACEIEPMKISAYSIGFIIAPSFNAVGRLSHVSKVFRLLQTEDPAEAASLAQEIRLLNEERKAETEKGTEEADGILEQQSHVDSVLVMYLPGIHESVAGIIAGRLKEHYARPVFVFTDTENGEGEEMVLKGSGRSIEPYHMLEHLIPAADLLERFGGHHMAAGLSVRKKNLEKLRNFLNEHSGLTEKDLVNTVYIDARLPMNYLSEKLVQEIELLEPCGAENPAARFGKPHFHIHSLRRMGKEQNMLKMTVSDETGVRREAVMFHDTGEFLESLTERYGKEEVEKAFRSRENMLDAGFVYDISVNEFRGEKTLQLIIESAQLY